MFVIFKISLCIGLCVYFGGMAVKLIRGLFDRVS